jgi:DNA-binding NtrC family response regulator
MRDVRAWARHVNHSPGEMTVMYSLPTLRDRPEDIEALTCYSLIQLGREDGRAITATSEALDALRGHRWPGNARGLNSLLEGARSIAAGQVLTDREILEALGRTAASDTAVTTTADRRSVSERAFVSCGAEPSIERRSTDSEASESAPCVGAWV